MKTLTNDEISQIVDQYKLQENLQRREIDYLESEILKLKIQQNKEFKKPIYALLYKPEYGDYYEFFEKIAEELRKRKP
jgi:hypothetical protein